MKAGMAIQWKLLLAVLLLSTTTLWSFPHLGGEESDSLTLLTFDFREDPPPLELVIHYAEQYSPLLKTQEALIRKNEFDVKRTKWLALDALRFNLNTNYGVYTTDAGQQVFPGVGLGVSLNFSVFDMMSIRSQVGIYEQELMVSRYKREELYIELRKIVIRHYNDLLMKRELVMVTSEAYESASVHLEMAQKEFKEGEIPVGEVARVSEIYSDAKIEMVKSLTDFQNAVMLLQELVGVNLNEITMVE